MDIMELGAIGELVGGVAVIGTLIYLALQIRQSSHVSSLDAGRSIANEVATFLEQVSLDPEVHSVWTRGIVSRELLEEAEADRFGRLVAALFLRLYNAHRQAALDPELARHYDHMARYHLRMDAVQEWWDRQRDTVMGLLPEVGHYVDERLAEVRSEVRAA